MEYRNISSFIFVEKKCSTWNIYHYRIIIFNMKKKKRLRFRKSFIRKLRIIFFLAAILSIMFLPLFIRINGERKMELELNEYYQELGAKTIFGTECEISGEVDTSKIGKYKVKYKFLTQSATRTVTVVDKTEPEIIINDFDDIYVFINNPFQIPQVSVIDNYDGDITDKVLIESNVDTTKLGDYQIIYTVSDQSNNIAKKTVNVHVRHDDDFFNKKTGEIPSKIIETVKKFTNSFHKSLKYLSFDLCSDLFASNEFYYIYQNLQKFNIDIRKNSPTNLYLIDVKYDLDFLSYSETDYGYVVRLNETYSHRYDYANSEDAIHQIFCRYRLNDDFKIIGFYREEGIYYSYLDGYISNDNYKQELQSFLKTKDNKYQATHESLINQLNRVNNSIETIENTVYKTAKYSYNRQKAVDYARSYALNPNHNYPFFEAGNCVNFCSQCFYNGGMKMIYEGSGTNQWKYYDNYTNHQEGKEGYTLSWSALYYFMDFAKRQNNFVVQTSLNPFLAQKGDMIVFGQDNKTYDHAVIVTDIIKDEAGNIVDIIYCGNTNNVKNGSFWADTNGYMELEKIIGSN